jgi:hypothetical protein
MNSANLAPRPTRSTLRNRRIVLDLKSSNNGSYVGANGLKGGAREDLKFNNPTQPSDLMVKTIAAVLLVALAIVLIVL